MSTLIGHRIANRYDIQSLIGQGGMGVVYRGYDSMLQRAVAVKVLPLQMTIDPHFVQRFQQEAVVAANLRHPGIVTIYDVGVHPGDRAEMNTYYIVMEYLDGVTLDQWLVEHGPMALDQISQVVSQAAAALGYAHEQGVIHRDIKPSNLMIGAKGRVTLMDFGLVRAGEGSGLTRSNVVMGTPDYMAPEQALGQPVDWRADIYALGVVIYKCLTGVVPFARTTPMAVAVAHAYEPPPPPRSLRPDLPKPVEAVAMKALAKQPAERYQRAVDLARDFALAATGKMPAGLRALPTPPAGVQRAVAPSSAASAARPSSGPPLNTVSPGQAQTPAGTSAPPEAVTMLSVPGAQVKPYQKRSAMVLPLVAVSALAVIAVLLLALRSGDRIPVTQTAVVVTATAQAASPETNPLVSSVTSYPASDRELIATETPAMLLATDTSASTTAMRTAASASRPVNTPIAATSTPASRPTNTKTALVSPTPTARQVNTAGSAATTPAAGASAAAMYEVVPVLLSPSEGANSTGEQSFTWRWAGPTLRENERFNWRLLHGVSGENVVDARTLTTSGLTYSLSSLASGDYYWNVRVIQVGSNGEFVALRSPEATRRLLRWNPPVQNLPTSTPVPPPPTNTPRPTDTPVPPTNTPRPTDTPVPPTNTPRPTDTPVPPTNTPRPTDTPAPPPPITDTPAPPPTPISRSFVPAGDAQDLRTAGVGGVAGFGLFMMVIGLSLWKERRRR